MEPTPLCSVCASGLPQLKCYCMEIPLALCSSCAPSHFLLDSQVPHSPSPAETSSESLSPCEVCRLSPAQSICTCLFPWISYCGDCASVHVSSVEGHLKHSLEPLHAREFLESAGSLAAYYERQQLVDALQARVKLNLAQVEDCVIQVNGTAAELTLSIEGWRASQVQVLEGLRREMEVRVQGCLQLLEPLRYRKEVDSQTRIEQLVQLSTRSTLDSALEEVSLVQITLEPERLIRQLPLLCQLASNEDILAPLQRLYLPCKGSNKLLRVDLPSEALFETVLDSDYRFKPQSCWCLLPSSQLFLGGGHIAKDAHIYYKETSLVDPTARSVTPYPSMLSARCRHAAVYHKHFIYVFGGYCEAYLKSCEKLDLEHKTWTSLPDMKDAKDCVTAAVWKDRVYIVGYGSNKIETYDVASENLFVLPITLRDGLMNLIVPKYCALVGIEAGELLVLLGSQLLRVNIEGQNARAFPLAMERDWYSQCSAVTIRGETVYFFSLEMELWKLHLPTASIHFVLKPKAVL